MKWEFFCARRPCVVHAVHPCMSITLMHILVLRSYRIIFYKYMLAYLPSFIMFISKERGVVTGRQTNCHTELINPIRKKTWRKKV